MKKLTLILMSTTLVLSSFALSSCAVTTAGLSKNNERSFVRSLDDVSAGRAIKARMLRAPDIDLGEVDVEVAQGIVLLTGNVDDQQARIEAERIAWSGPKVIEVGNEVQIKDGHGFIRNTKDGFLNKSVKTRLIAASGVKSSNFNVETHDGIVYLLGIARTPEELTRAAEIASTTRGAREVISYVRVVEGQTPQSYPQYQSPAQAAPSVEYSAPQISTPQVSAPTYRALPGALSAAPSAPGEPIYRDPKTGEIIELAPGTKTIPYRPNAGGASALPQAFPSDDELGRYRVGTPGEAVSTIESAPYYIDPETGKQIPVRFIQDWPK